MAVQEAASRGIKRATSRNWCATWYDIQVSDEAMVEKMAGFVLNDKLIYAVWNRERCPTTNREHYQMWLVTKPVRFLLFSGFYFC